MAGTTVSFIADPKLAARVEDIARSDGVTRSQAAARASALGALLPPAARRTLRFVLAEGGDEAQKQLTIALAKAIAQVGNSVVERQLLARSREAGLIQDDGSEEEGALRAVDAVRDYRRALTDAPHEPSSDEEPAPSGGFGD